VPALRFASGRFAFHGPIAAGARQSVPEQKKSYGFGQDIEATLEIGTASIYFIHEGKVRAPAAAMALIEKLKS
jgi:hypothetical protein